MSVMRRRVEIADAPAVSVLDHRDGVRLADRMEQVAEGRAAKRDRQRPQALARVGAQGHGDPRGDRDAIGVCTLTC